jgi:hypothetical protein
MLLYDVQGRKLLAQEHAELLRAQAEASSSQQSARIWLSEHLIAAGERLAPDCTRQRRPLRAAS